MSPLFRVLRLIGSLRRAVFLLLLLASLALNVATVTSTAVFAAVSGAVSAVSGAGTVLARHKAERQAQKTAIRRTSARVSQRLARGAARSTAASAGEAVPYLGAAVVAAALAWDIRDACATAQDMAVLEAQLDDPGVAPEDVAFDCTDLIPGADDLPSAGDLLRTVRDAPAAAWEALRDPAEAPAAE